MQMKYTITATTTGTPTIRPLSAVRTRWGLSPSGMRALVWIGSLTVLAAVLRTWRLATTNLWLDEANSWLVASYSLHDLLANLRASPASPLYFVLLHGWLNVFGDSERALRALSVVASLTLIPITYALGRQTTSLRGALMAAMLTALSPLHLYFAQEARVYMLATCLATSCVLSYTVARRAAAGASLSIHAGLIRLRRHPLVPLAAYVITAILAVYTLVLTALIPIALNIDAMVERARMSRVDRSHTSPAWKRWLLAQGLIVCACLPLAMSVNLQSAVASQAWRTSPGVIHAVRALLDYCAATIHGGNFVPWDLYRAIVGQWGVGTVAERLLVYPVTLLALCAAVTYPPLRGNGRNVRLLYLVWLVPLLTGAGISVSHDLNLTRYFLFTTPIWYLIVGAGCARMPRRPRALAVGILVAAMVVSINAYRAVTTRDSDYRPVARRLIERVRRGDHIVVQPREMGVPLDYYLRRLARSPDGMDSGSALTCCSGMDATATLADLAAPGAGTRLWIVLDYRSRAFGDSPDAIAHALRGAVISDALVSPTRSGVRLIEEASRQQLPTTPAR
jgi:mannosyltransferase